MHERGIRRAPGPFLSPRIPHPVSIQTATYLKLSPQPAPRLVELAPLAAVDLREVQIEAFERLDTTSAMASRVNHL